MIRYILISVLLLSTAIRANSQINEIIFESDSGNLFFIDGIWNMGSNNLSNTFIRDFRDGGLLSQESINSQIDLLDSKNLIGNRQQYQLFYSWDQEQIFGVKDLQMFVNYRYAQLFETQFSDNVFKLTFLGNSPFEGEVLDLGSAFYQSMAYHQFKLGIIKTIDMPSYSLTGGFAFGFNFGIDNIHLDIESASVYTEKFGEFVDMSLKYDLMMSDTVPKGLMDMRGNGPVADFFYIYEYNPGLSNSGISLGISFTDLGFIGWRGETNRITKDTSFTYSGWEVENIFQWQDNAFEGFGYDTLKSIFILDENRPYYTNLPTTLGFTARYRFPHNRTWLQADIRKQFFSKARPFVELKAGLNIGKYFCVMPALSWGGYGDIDGGIALRAGKEHHWYFQFGSYHTSALFMPDKATSIDVLGRFVYFINPPKPKIEE